MKRKNWNFPEYCTAKISYDTKECPRRIFVTQIPAKHQTRSEF